eukprot:Skav209299  [mRNA]  locus=scaffold994:102016:109823:+ [translate_table: standard]
MPGIVIELGTGTKHDDKDGNMAGFNRSHKTFCNMLQQAVEQLLLGSNMYFNYHYVQAGATCHASGSADVMNGPAAVKVTELSAPDGTFGKMGLPFGGVVLCGVALCCFEAAASDILLVQLPKVKLSKSEDRLDAWDGTAQPQSPWDRAAFKRRMKQRRGWASVPYTQGGRIDSAINWGKGGVALPSGLSNDAVAAPVSPGRRSENLSPRQPWPGLRGWAWEAG